MSVYCSRSSSNLITLNRYSALILIILDHHSLPKEVNHDLKIAVAELAQGKWQRLLLYLGLNEKATSEYENQTQDNVVRAYKIISDWKLKKGREASVSKLVTACHKIDISEDEIVREYKRLTRGEGPR